MENDKEEHAYRKFFEIDAIKCTVMNILRPLDPDKKSIYFKFYGYYCLDKRKLQEATRNTIVIISRIIYIDI